MALIHFAATSKPSQPISPGTSVLYTTLVELLGLEGEGLGWTALRGREGPWVGKHMKGQLCHLWALMTDWAGLFWLKISFNMHDKRRPSGTLPGNGTESPDKLMLFLLIIVSSSSAVVEVPSQCKGSCLSKTFYFWRSIQCAEDEQPKAWWAQKQRAHS